jgi:16S rRNA (cytidine1402-2'-O)-methyltransferase
LVRAVLAEGLRVVAVPGPSAVIAALSIAGLPTDRFTFEGFLPQRASARDRALEMLKREPRTMVFFEAARRLAATLAAMERIFEVGRGAAVVREMTKTFEESVRGTLAELRARFAANEARGEIVIVVAGAPESSTTTAAADKDTGVGAITVEALCEAGVSLKDASAAVARVTGASRRELYRQALARRVRD